MTNFQNQRFKTKARISYCRTFAATSDLKIKRTFRSVLTLKISISARHDFYNKSSVQPIFPINTTSQFKCLEKMKVSTQYSPKPPSSTTPTKRTRRKCVQRVVWLLYPLLSKASISIESWKGNESLNQRIYLKNQKSNCKAM